MRKTIKELALLIFAALQGIEKNLGEHLTVWSHEIKKRIEESIEALENNLEMTVEDFHNIWLHQKIKEGYIYGKYKDEQGKVSPYLLPYGKLTDEQKEKVNTFYGMVKDNYKGKLKIVEPKKEKPAKRTTKAKTYDFTDLAQFDAEILKIKNKLMGMTNKVKIVELQEEIGDLVKAKLKFAGVTNEDPAPEESANNSFKALPASDLVAADPAELPRKKAARKKAPKKVSAPKKKKAKK